MVSGPLEGSKLRLEGCRKDFHLTGAEKELKLQGSWSKCSRKSKIDLYLGHLDFTRFKQIRGLKAETHAHEVQAC